MAGGTGTAADPFLIETAQEWLDVGNSNANKHFKITNHLEFLGLTYVPKNWGSSSNTGITINGNGFEIRNISHVGGLNSGFLSDSSGGTFKNMTLRNCKFASSYVGASYGRVGALIGQLTNYANGTFDNCHVIDCEIGNGVYSGGLVGCDKLNCIYVNCSVIGGFVKGTTAGGLLGLSERQARITNCFTTSPVEGTNGAGGIIGQIGDANNFGGSGYIKTSYSSSVVKSSSNCGGLVSQNFNTSVFDISDSYALNPYIMRKIGSVATTFGDIMGATPTKFTITNCRSLDTMELREG